MMKKMQDLSLKGKKVLLRVDFNVPLDKQGRITDDARIRAALPSIRSILEQGASLILMSHLGRPKGVDPKLSLAPCAKRLSELLHRNVVLAPDCVGSTVQKMAQELKPGEILLLENLRFHAGEENPDKDPTFTKQLAHLGDAYVNDAFATAHRAHASTACIAAYFPGLAAAGLLMQKEVVHLGALLHAPKRPFYAIIGGAKVSTKIGVMKALLAKVDALFIGGAMAFPFLQAQGYAMGDSPVEQEAMPLVHALLEQGAQKILLPQDLVIASDARTQVVRVQDGIPKGWQGVDIGPATIDAWSQSLHNAKTVFWNGPLGMFENLLFAKGTFAIAKVLAELHASVIVGGGDSVAAIHTIGLESRFAYVSTGGGAALEFLENGTLPGIDALQ